MCENLSGFLQQIGAAKQILEVQAKKAEDEKKREEAKRKKQGSPFFSFFSFFLCLL